MLNDKLVQLGYVLLRGPLVQGLAAEVHEYLRPGLHPDDLDTEPLLREWQRELFGADGELLDGSDRHSEIMTG